MAAESRIAQTRFGRSLREDGCELWLCSHGGCATNAVSHWIESALRTRVRTDLWKAQACHAPAPDPYFEGPLVYLMARDPLPCLVSQAARGLLAMNLAKMRGQDPLQTPIEYGVHDYAGLSIAPWVDQARAWSVRAGLVIVYEELTGGLARLAYLLGLDVELLDPRPRTTRTFHPDTLSNLQRAADAIADDWRAILDTLTP